MPKVNSYRRKRNGRKEKVRRHVRTDPLLRRILGKPFQHRKGGKNKGFSEDALKALGPLFGGVAVCIGMLIQITVGTITTIIYCAVVILAVGFGTKTGKRIMRRTRKQWTKKAKKKIGTGRVRFSARNSAATRKQNARR